MNVGDVIGEYRLSFRLGEGPRGVVWRASRVDRVQNAILKVIKPTAVDGPRAMQKAFDRLSHTLGKHGRFDHPNLAAVLGTARRPEDGLFGLASEYLEARNLDVYPFRGADARTIADDASAFANLLSVIEQLASVVMWLHMSGTLHGDLKPSNVLVVPTDRGLQVKLTDLIWSRAGFGAFTEYQRMYVAPEVAAGHPATPASDQWGVAKILHQLIVKGSPGRSQTEALSLLPVDLLKAIQCAMDTNPGNRFPTMAPFVEAVRQIRMHQQEAGDPIRMRAHQIGYSPTVPVSANAVTAAKQAQTAAMEPPRAPRSAPSPVRSRDITEKELSYGSIGAQHEDEDLQPPRSNALSWIAIVVASVMIAVGGGYLLIGLSEDETPAISAAPPDPAPAKMIDEPPRQPDPPVEEPPPPPALEPAAGEHGAEVARRCKAGKSNACIEAGELFLEGRGGLPASKDEALALFDRACQLRSMNGCVRAADVLVELGEPKRARRLYEKACDSAQAAACAKLAELWREGAGGAKNERTADAFENRACQLGRKSSCK